MLGLVPFLSPQLSQLHPHGHGDSSGSFRLLWTISSVDVLNHCVCWELGELGSSIPLEVFMTPLYSHLVFYGDLLRYLPSDLLVYCRDCLV